MSHLPIPAAPVDDIRREERNMSAGRVRVDAPAMNRAFEYPTVFVG